MGILSRRSALSALLGVACTACATAAPVGRGTRSADVPQGPAPFDGPRRLDLPPRRRGHLSGSRFVARCRKLRAAAREAAVVEELLGGNVPEFLRGLVAVRLAGNPDALTLWVTPDYLAVGDDRDFVRVPMNGRSARKVACAAGCMLPTRHIVDAVHEQAEVKLTSPHYGSVRDGTASSLWAAHHRAIERRRIRKGGRLGALTSGHKKDLVMSRRQLIEPRRLAIYGWFRPDGEPIQSLSLVHDQDYADYSHGVRLVDERAELAGVQRPLRTLLADGSHCALASDEGAFEPFSCG